LQNFIEQHKYTHTQNTDEPADDGEALETLPSLLAGVSMGWIRLLCSLKVKVFLAKEPYKRDDILQKRPRILRSLLIVATPICEFGY